MDSIRKEWEELATEYKDLEVKAYPGDIPRLPFLSISCLFSIDRQSELPGTPGGPRGLAAEMPEGHQTPAIQDEPDHSQHEEVSKQPLKSLLYQKITQRID